MAIYVVQAAGPDTVALERARFVPDGFSWPAFLLGEVWLVYHRLWLPLVIWVVAEGAFFGLLFPHLSASTAVLIGIIAHLYLGFEGNGLRVARGDRKAAITDVVASDRRDNAEAEFFRRYVVEGGQEAGSVGGAEA